MTKAKPARPVGLTRKHLARVERERRLRRMLIGGVSAILAIVVGLIAYPIVDRRLIQPGQPVAIVNGVEISTREFQKQVRYSRLRLIDQYWNLQQYATYLGQDPQFQSQVSQVTASLNSSFSLGRDVLDRMIEEELVRQEAARRGITVSPDEVDALIRESFRYFPNGTPTLESTRTEAPSATAAPTRTGQPAAAPSLTPTLEQSPALAPTETPTAGPTPTETPIPTITPTPTPYTGDLFHRDFMDFVARFGRVAGMSEVDVRRVFEGVLYRRKLTETWEATPQVESVHARHILVADEATAQDILKKLQAGEDFSNLAARYSTDTSNKDLGGDLGFFQRNQMAPEFEKAALDNPIGLAPQPVKTSFGWHVIEVLERRDESLEQARDRALADWLKQQRDDPKVVTTLQYWEQRVPAAPLFDPSAPPTPFATSTP